MVNIKIGVLQSVYSVFSHYKSIYFIKHTIWSKTYVNCSRLRQQVLIKKKIAVFRLLSQWTYYVKLSRYKNDKLTFR